MASTPFSSCQAKAYIPVWPWSCRNQWECYSGSTTCADTRVCMSCPARPDYVPGRNLQQTLKNCPVAATKPRNNGGAGETSAHDPAAESPHAPAGAAARGTLCACVPAPLPPLPAGRGRFTSGAAPRTKSAADASPFHCAAPAARLRSSCRPRRPHRRHHAHVRHLHQCLQGRRARQSVGRPHPAAGQGHWQTRAGEGGSGANTCAAGARRALREGRQRSGPGASPLPHPRGGWAAAAEGSGCGTARRRRRPRCSGGGSPCPFHPAALSLPLPGPCLEQQPGLQERGAHVAGDVLRLCRRPGFEQRRCAVARTHPGGRSHRPSAPGSSRRLSLRHGPSWARPQQPQEPEPAKTESLPGSPAGPASRAVIRRCELWHAGTAFGPLSRSAPRRGEAVAGRSACLAAGFAHTQPRS